MTDTQVTWLTQESYDRLKSELDQLIANRPIIAAEINDRREEGDLRENGGYHAAREEQGQQEARIRQLEVMLRDAQIGEAPATSSTVEPGMQVTICYDGDPDDTDTFLLGSRELMALAGNTEVEVFSPQSPLGSAIIGKKIGDTASYSAPNGKPIDVTILEVEPYVG